MTKPLIGVTCDSDAQMLRLKHGYIEAVARAGGMPLVIAPLSKAVAGDSFMENITRIAGLIDGLLLSGGDDLLTEYYNEDVAVPPESLKFTRKERSDFELLLLREVMKKQKPVLGICYGMQLINAAFGGSLYQDLGFQVKRALDHKRGAHDIEITPSFASAFGIQPSTFVVNSSHHQAVKEIGKGLEVFSMSEDGIIEGFFNIDYSFLAGVQWHPERPVEDVPPLNGLEDDFSLLSKPGTYDKLSIKILEVFVTKAGCPRL